MMQAGSATTLGGFSGSVHERTIDKVTDTITVYSNRGGPKAVLFNTYYDGGGTQSNGVDSMSTGVLTLETGTDTGKSDLFYSAWFPTGDGVSKSIPLTDDPDTREVDETKVAGMFNDIAGMYSCDSGTCTVTNDDKGKITTLTGQWIFTPSDDLDLDKLKIPDVDHDADYLSFGYWVRATEKDDGSTAYGIGTFTTGVPMFTAFSGLEGTAKYAGKAAGMYAKKTLTPSGGVDTLTTGHFTADANLVASFEGDTVAVADHFSVTGTVSNFDDASSGNRVDSAWMVELGKGTVNQDTGAIADGTTTGQGEWAGQFYGTPDTTVTDTAKQYPSGVANQSGEFDGHFANGHVLGAFGATRQ